MLCSSGIPVWIPSDNIDLNSQMHTHWELQNLSFLILRNFKNDFVQLGMSRPKVDPSNISITTSWAWPEVHSAINHVKIAWKIRGENPIIIIISYHTINHKKRTLQITLQLSCFSILCIIQFGKKWKKEDIYC